MTARLHVETDGNGPDVVLLHGWGTHGGLFREFANRLATRHRVFVPDLPGHGFSGHEEVWRLEELVDRLARVLPVGAAWVGWSLGALPAIRAAAIPDLRVASLGLVAGTPRFVGDEQWPAMSVSEFRSFAAGVEADAGEAMRRFQALQCRGLPGVPARLAALRARLAERDAPARDALLAGLALLRQADLRATFAALDLPLHVVLGQRDAIVPPDLGAAMQRLNPRAEVRIVDGASHLPFLTHVDETIAALGFGSGAGGPDR